MLIFLDIDGVLNTEKDWSHPYTLNPTNVDHFGRFAKEKRGKIILTSSWRSGFISSHHPKNTPQIQQLEKMLDEYNIRIVGKTPKLGKPRDVEIQSFLQQHQTEDYIIIDDDKNEFQEINKKMVFVNSKKGF